MRIVLLIIVVLLVIGAFPVWPHSMNWGYFPSGGIGLILLIFIVLMVVGVVWARPEHGGETRPGLP